MRSVPRAGSTQAREGPTLRTKAPAGNTHGVEPTDPPVVVALPVEVEEVEPDPTVAVPVARGMLVHAGRVGVGAETNTVPIQGVSRGNDGEVRSGSSIPEGGEVTMPVTVPWK